MRTIRVTILEPRGKGASTEVSIETIAPENSADAEFDGAETMRILQAFLSGMKEAQT